MTRPTRHSYSSISTYEQCPAKYGYSYVEKRATVPSAAMARGTRLHSLAEKYLLDPGVGPAPYELKKIGVRLHFLRSQKAVPEQTWLVTDQWERTEEPAAARVKAIIDVHYLQGDTLHVYDFKSGREYPSHFSQLDLYSCMGLIQYPDARRAESGAVYIDAGHTGAVGGMLREMLPHSIDGWEGRIRRLEADTSLVPTPGAHCRWCNFARANGGPCDATVQLQP